MLSLEFDDETFGKTMDRVTAGAVVDSDLIIIAWRTLFFTVTTASLSSSTTDGSFGGRLFVRLRCVRLLMIFWRRVIRLDEFVLCEANASIIKNDRSWSLSSSVPSRSGRKLSFGSAVCGWRESDSLIKSCRWGKLDCCCWCCDDRSGISDVVKYLAWSALLRMSFVVGDKVSSFDWSFTSCIVCNGCWGLETSLPLFSFCCWKRRIRVWWACVMRGERPSVVSRTLIILELFPGSIESTWLFPLMS